MKFNKIPIKYTPWINIRRLMGELIENAKHDLKEPKSSIEYRLAYEWLTSDDRDGYPFSFVNACEVLDFDPNYIREGILEPK